MKRQLASLSCQVLPTSTKTHKALQSMRTATPWRGAGTSRAKPCSVVLSPPSVTTIDRLTGRCEDIRPRFLPGETLCRRAYTARWRAAQRAAPSGHRRAVAGAGDLSPSSAITGPITTTWRFHYLDGGREDWHTPLSLSHFERPALLALVMLQLDGQRLLGPVESIELHCDQLTAMRPQREQLFSDSAQEQQDAQQMLFNKLRLRIGEHGIRRLEQRDEWLPEYQGVASPLANYRHNAMATTVALRPTYATGPAAAVTRARRPAPVARPTGAAARAGTYRQSLVAAAPGS